MKVEYYLDGNKIAEHLGGPVPHGGDGVVLDDHRYIVQNVVHYLTRMHGDYRVLPTAHVFLLNPLSE